MPTGTVLVVDDDERISTFLQMALADEGYEVALAPDGAAALAPVADVAPCVILLDIAMPVMDGLTFAREHRARVTVGAPLVCMAASHAPRHDHEIAAAGCLSKPFELDDFLAVVNWFCRAG